MLKITAIGNPTHEDVYKRQLRTVTSTSNNDKSLVRIFFKVVSSFFAKDKQTKFPRSADVYKRQVLSISEIFIRKIFGRKSFKNNPGISQQRRQLPSRFGVKILIALITVSYTHLDVYKRQVPASVPITF